MTIDTLASPQRLALDESVSDQTFAAALCPHMPIDPGIVRAVRVLWAAGIEVYESCEGGEGHCLPEPTVRFHGSAGAGWKAVGAAQESGLPLLELRRAWALNDGEPTGPTWEIVLRRVS